MEVEMEDSEAQLVTYLQNILKCQIIPMEFMDLRDLVQDAPRKLKLYKFLQDIYPGDRFLDFLRKYPHIFTLNPNRTVVLTEGNSFTLPYANANNNVSLTRDYDEVDGRDNEEYISNPSESDNESDKAKSDDDEEEEEEENRSTASVSESDSDDSSDDNGDASSSIPDSSARDNALTSDSDASSLSSIENGV